MSKSSPRTDTKKEEFILVKILLTRKGKNFRHWRLNFPTDFLFVNFNYEIVVALPDRASSKKGTFFFNEGQKDFYHKTNFLEISV